MPSSYLSSMREVTPGYRPLLSAANYSESM